ncbi:shikimate kinase [Leifsonia xyli subsp. xyli]|uniref:Shikimate kinase n=1 Tax=Leifsonia xyli subsp. xyli TaxID=59736 RepID=A0A1E2SKQ3_LEIXY|nr:shikimate kinase [Leifsonia xyli]ODA90432.1 shikimate kinase [Leifsonia xyli subsp. xyli]
MPEREAISGSTPSPTVVLIGPPAAGKTRVGKRLAKRLGASFIDSDAVIVARHGSIADIFAEHGEPHFRAVERAVVAEAVRRPGVVSLGGGAVIDPATRADLEGKRVVLLTVLPEAIAKRIQNGKRPLVSDLESWKRLVASRQDLYAALADFTADTSSRPMETIVEEIARWVEQTGVAEEESR